MFLEDFSSEPIAMCKILLYVESIEIHIAGENDMKRLAWLSVEDYAATQMELVVVSAMKGYLRRMPEKDAFKKVEAILDPKVIRLEEAGDVMHLSQNVVETFIDRIEVFNDERVKIHFTFENVLADYAE